MQQFLTSALSLSVLSIFIAIAFCLDQKDDLESQVMIKMFESFENAEKQREYRKMKNEYFSLSADDILSLDEKLDMLKVSYIETNFIKQDEVKDITDLLTIIHHVTSRIRKESIPNASPTVEKFLQKALRLVPQPNDHPSRLNRNIINLIRSAHKLNMGLRMELKEIVEDLKNELAKHNLDVWEIMKKRSFNSGSILGLSYHIYYLLNHSYKVLIEDLKF
ncbi:hypothetical protein WR25_03312 [Diploscapter pachys]|uniref:Prolyl 4-hydroxylase alpha-subunit N-terminal domain-containing protein n=1 Tax=Diploscapter pachys TaxID=2018661 RepID=A0A2A2L356_9BILA|nr:hypothetical protein WR25_03312 [Diploscapter pachys]